MRAYSLSTPVSSSSSARDFLTPTRNGAQEKSRRLVGWVLTCVARWVVAPDIDIDPRRRRCARCGGRTQLPDPSGAVAAAQWCSISRRRQHLAGVMAPSDLPLSNWMSMCTLRLDLPLDQQLRVGRISTTLMASNGPLGLPSQEGVLRRAATRADKKEID